MLQHEKSKEDRKVERRKHWRDRRVTPDRRHANRLQQSSYDCRSGTPRRHSDLAGVLEVGEVWWQQDTDR